VDDDTVKVADVVVALPYSLEKTASKCSPFSAVVAVNEYVSDVAPLIADQLLPVADSSHWTVGVGEPEAAALNEAVDPDVTASFDGSSVILGAVRRPPPKAGAAPG
jgi:hypothetical protein